MAVPQNSTRMYAVSVRWSRIGRATQSFNSDLFNALGMLRRSSSFQILETGSLDICAMNWIGDERLLHLKQPRVLTD